VGFLSECFTLIRDWIAVDRIRSPKHTGRLGSLRMGDRFLYRDSVFIVVSSEILSSSETEIRSILQLVDSGATPLTHWELVVIATSQPTISLAGILRRLGDDNGREESITDSDIVVLKFCADSEHCIDFNHCVSTVHD
jgi:hypothetical protein